MSYPSELTDDQWALLEPVFNAPSKRGRKYAADLRTFVDAMLYIVHTGCQWRYRPASFGPWTRVWSQFRRWSRNGTWARALVVRHAAAREADGRAEATPSMVVIDTHLARGACNAGLTFYDRGGPYGRTKGARRVVAFDVTGLPVGALVVPAPPTRTGPARQLMLEQLPPRRSVAGSPGRPGSRAECVDLHSYFLSRVGQRRSRTSLGAHGHRERLLIPSLDGPPSLDREPAAR